MDYTRLTDYDYHLPPELIAQEPLAIRDLSRMMVLNRKERTIKHERFENLSGYLNPGDTLVLNDTKVIPARLAGTIEDRNTPAEILLLRKEDEHSWIAMVKPGRKLKPGAIVNLSEGVKAIVEGYAEEGLRVIRFTSQEPFDQLLFRLGKVPLPPYIKKNVENPDQYQTIYAAKQGSAAAPTAGFHFTERSFKALAERGVKKVFITLHIGPGTFQPVKADDIRDHVMHREYFQVTPETANCLNKTRASEGRIVAIGTTACRVLESIADEDGIVQPFEGWTGLYIYPGYRFKAVDALLTNFHLPRSSLLMLVSALAGRDLIKEAYKEAVAERYRFFSFGDCMLIT